MWLSNKGTLPLVFAWCCAKTNGRRFITSVHMEGCRGGFDSSVKLYALCGESAVFPLLLNID